MATILHMASSNAFFMDGTFGILFQISWKFLPESPLDIKLTWVEVMVWQPTGNKPLPKPMVAKLGHKEFNHK